MSTYLQDTFEASSPRIRHIDTPPRISCNEEAILPTAVIAILSTVCAGLALLNVYQYLAKKGAQRLAEVLYIVSRNVAERAQVVKRQQKDVEIVEAQLQDVVTTARTLLVALGRSEESLDPDPNYTIFNGSQEMSKEGLLRMADRLLFSVREENPHAEHDEIVSKTMERFLLKVPSLDETKAQKIIHVVFNDDSIEAERGKSSVFKARMN